MSNGIEALHMSLPAFATASVSVLLVCAGTTGCRTESSAGFFDEDAGSSAWDATGLGSGSLAGDEGPGSSSSSGASATAPEGGLPSNPGMVTCGNTMCDTTTMECCANTTADAGGGGTCVSINGTCSSGVTQVCDEAADCSGGAVCCAALACGIQSTRCEASCGTGAFQLCRTDSECGTNTDAGNAQRCIVQTCSSQCPNENITIEACAYPSTGTIGGGFPGVGLLGGGLAEGGVTMNYGALPGCTAN